MSPKTEPTTTVHPVVKFSAARFTKLSPGWVVPFFSLSLIAGFAKFENFKQESPETYKNEYLKVKVSLGLRKSDVFKSSNAPW